MTTRFTLWLTLIAWCLCTAIGVGAMVAYETTPARTLAPASHWPSKSLLARDPDLPTLVVFIHPRCPCSRASLTELSELASQCVSRVAIRIVFVRPAGCGEGWEETDLWARAKQIPGASVSVDRSGSQADLFRATTSGESFLYAPSGRLLFHGGITVSRGHEGDSSGRASLAALIDGGAAPQDSSPVYGCSLSNRCCPPVPSSAHASDPPRLQ